MIYYGFNFQWMFSRGRSDYPMLADKRALDFLAHFGFNFVRIPTDYRFWVNDFDYFHPDESVFEYLDRYLEACRTRGIHMSLNIHRAPGYCINRNDLEKHNLWSDEIAQDAFVFQWEKFAQRYLGITGEELSFDLLNEPPGIGQYGMTRHKHAALIRRTVAAIRAIDPDRLIVIDGLGGGNLPMPELADLGVIHSGRGYQPMAVSHYQAGWWDGSADLPEPEFPNMDWDGVIWNCETLRSFYQPWRDVQALGTAIHIGEFGCFNKTPNSVALRWLADLLSIYKEFGWGYALWEFDGPFGIGLHGRPGASYESVLGYPVDRSLLDLLLQNRVDAL